MWSGFGGEATNGRPRSLEALGIFWKMHEAMHEGARTGGDWGKETT